MHETETIIKDAAFGFVHDFIVSENYYVIVENPTRMDFWKLLTQYTLGKACIAECLYQDMDRPMKVWPKWRVLFQFIVSVEKKKI